LQSSLIYAFINTRTNTQRVYLISDKFNIHSSTQT